jgi:hypothetical protein
MLQKAEHLEQGPLKASRLEKNIFWKENPHFAAKLGLLPAKAKNNRLMGQKKKSRFW